MTLDSIIAWLDESKHIAAIGALGIFAGQVAIALPDSKFRTFAINFLHGFFPSIQVMATGTVTTPKLAPATATVAVEAPTPTPVTAVTPAVDPPKEAT